MSEESDKTDDRDSKRCPECKSTNLKCLGTREIRNPKAGPDAPVLAKTINIIQILHERLPHAAPPPRTSPFCSVSFCFELRVFW